MKKHQLILLVVASIILISGTLDLGNLFNYANQPTPNFAAGRDNSPQNNKVSDIGATLGRVLFYDKALSTNNTISCASCHKQEFAFGDNEPLSATFDGGKTERHSMRIVNIKYAQEGRAFWDEREPNLERQSIAPISTPEMGFTGTDGNPGFDDLLRKLAATDRYPRLFKAVYGDENITSDRMAKALSQFMRSIQSFDSKYDEGRRQANGNDFRNFPNFTAEENIGKSLFLTRAGCQSCHRAPLFDIDPNSRNNGVIGVAGNPSAVDTRITKAPTLRDVFNNKGVLNGPLMHNASFNTMDQVIAHYNDVPVDSRNNNLDFRLRLLNFFNIFGFGGGNQTGQTLNLSIQDQRALTAFLKTLSGSEIYTAEKWSNPFAENGTLTIAGGEGVQGPVCASGDTDGDGICNDLDDCPLDASNTCAEQSVCDQINLTTNGLSDVIIETPPAFFKIIQVRTLDGQAIFTCFNNCTETTVIPNLQPGQYDILVRLYDESFSSICSVDGRLEMDPSNIEATGTTKISSRLATIPAINTTVKAVDKSTYQVYPNPAQQELFVDLKTYAGQKGNLRLINQLGQTIQSFDYDELPSDKIRLDINKVENGLYFLNIMLDDQEMVTERVMVRKL